MPAPRTPPRLLLTRDFGHESLRAAHRRGELLRVRAGAYIQPSTEGDTWRRRDDAALAMCVAVAGQLRCEYAFSHATAALIHGCWMWRLDSLTHVTQRSRPSGVVVGGLTRHHGRLPEEDVTVVNGLRVTTIERTIVDCARSMAPREALAVADSGLRMLVRPDRRARKEAVLRMEEIRNGLRARLEAQPGARGLVRARVIVARADGLSESAGETDLRWVALSRGLPPPTLQLPVVTKAGVFYLDLGWTLDGSTGTGRSVVGMEYDGAQKYAPRPGAAPGQPLYAEKAREDALREEGVMLQRYVKAHLREPDAAFARMCQMFPPALVARLRPVPGLRVPALQTRQ